mgnify:CR=1 FL=1
MAGPGQIGSEIKHVALPIEAEAANQYIPSLATSSLKEFYDDVVYWEIAKNTNKFFVTFERGQYAIQNNKQESIATMEIDFPRVSQSQNETTTAVNFQLSASNGGTRNQINPDAFFQTEELSPGTAYNHHQYNGFITTTTIRGTKFFQSNLTSSLEKPLVIDYHMMFPSSAGSNNEETRQKTREYSASYFYPFSQHQLSVLRKSPTIIIDLDKSSELEGYVAEKGFAVIPFQTHKRIKDNFEYYLEKAGIIEKTTKTKVIKKGK